MADEPNPAANPSGDPGGDPSDPGKAPKPSGPQNPPNPPPVAQIVVKGAKTERELALEGDLTKREQKIAELEKENAELKTPKTPPNPPPPAKVLPKKKSWLDGLTFFDD